MMINKLIIYKLINSSVVVLGILISIFFIVTLLGNLGESYEFKFIVYLSLLSSIQIFFYIPLLFFFITLSYFNFLLKNHNQLIIVRHYVSAKKIAFIFALFSIIFLILEVNKGYINQKIESYKINLTKNNSILDQQIYINHNGGNNRDYILISDRSRQEKKIVKYQILNNNFNEAIYSNIFFFINTNLMTDNYYKMLNNKITYHSGENLILENIKEFNKNRINHIGKIQVINFKKIFPITFLSLLFLLIIISLIGKKLLTKGGDGIQQYLLNVLIIFYSYIILSFNFTLFTFWFQILSLLFLLLLILKKILYEKSF